MNVTVHRVRLGAPYLSTTIAIERTAPMSTIVIKVYRRV